MWRILALLLVSIASLPLQAATVLVVGDSISAAYGMPVAKGWVSLLEDRIDQQGYKHTVVNASVSGETTAGGLNRLPQLLRQQRPAIVVLELGGNDGLRGLPVTNTRANIQQMVRLSRQHGAKVLLLGMEIPPNLGPRYTREFREVFTATAKQPGVALLPFLLQGVATNPDLMQSDGIHPNQFAQKKLLDNVWPLLEPLLKNTP